MTHSKKILFLNQAHPFLENHLSALGYHCVQDYETPKEELANQLPNYIGIVMRSRFNIDASFLKHGSHLKFIAREGVGIEHIDVTFAEKKGIKVITSPEGSMDTVAETTMGLLLCLLNNLAKADLEVKKGQWLREPNRGIEIKGKTVGLLGYGNMGKAVAQRLQGFGCEVIAYDKYKKDYSDAFAKEVSLEQLFEKTDILSLHIFFESSNFHFINDAFLQNFKKAIFIVNTARGLVLNTEDLVKNMKSGKVRGAALDVLEYEETSFENFSFENLPAPFQYLIESKKVVLSPHIAGWSFESKEGHARVLAKKIEALLK